MKRLEELYEETWIKIMIDGEVIDEFETKEGVRQGCPLSADLFNIAVSDIEEDLGKIQGGGVKIGPTRICIVSYADDMAIMAEDEDSMKRMIKRLIRYMKGKGLILNVVKTKMMCFRKAGGRRKEYNFMIEGKEIEMVKRFTYLGYEMKENNKETLHIRKIVAKANAVMGRMWSIGERRFKNNWRWRMRLFDTMVRGIVMYGVEIWGWKEQREIERLQEKYIKWILKVERQTPAYMLMLDTGREKMEVMTAKRIVRWEKKISGKDMNTLEGICWSIRKKENEKKREEIKEKTKEKERRRMMEKIGWAGIEWTRRIEEEGIAMELEIERKMMDLNRQE